MAYPAFSSGVQQYRPDMLRLRALSMGMPEASRARLAALGLPAQVLRAQQTSMIGEYQQAAPPPGGFQFQLRNWQGPAAQFSGGGKGHRPLVPGQMPLAPTPMQAYGSIIPRPAAPRPITLPPLRLMPGGNQNPWNIQQLKLRGIDPFGAKAYRRR